MADSFATWMKNGDVPMPKRRDETPSGGGVLPPEQEGGDDGEEKFLRNGVAPAVLRELRRHQPQGKIDLHGMTLAEAHANLDAFLVGARRRGWRRVEIVHGRGLHSSSGRAVLRGRVRAWLSACDKILAYTEVADNTGAVVALLAKTGK